MRPKILQKLVDGQPAPLPWALVSLPSQAKLKQGGWKCLQTNFNGGFYARADGLQARCRGIQPLGDKRWWHVIVGRSGASPKAVTQEDVSECIRVFFADTAMVLQVHVPDEQQDEEEHAGLIVHLWWALDGDAGVPPFETWEREPWYEPSEDAPRWE